jgi:chromosomal replication initiator protein
MILSIKHIEQVNHIQTIISQVTGISVNAICTGSRKAEIVQARHLSMYFCRYNTKLNTLEIAKLHGKTNHATVLHACNSIHKDRRHNQKLNEMFKTIDSSLNN